MAKILIKISEDWADEFQAEGFAYCDSALWDLLIGQEKIYFKTEVYFGTNEFLEFRDYDEYKSVFKITKLTRGQYNMLKNLFPEAEIKYERHPARKSYGASIMLRSRGFGIFPFTAPCCIDAEYEGKELPMYPDWARSNEESERELYYKLLDEFFDGEELTGDE